MLKIVIPGEKIASEKNGFMRYLNIKSAVMAHIQKMVSFILLYAEW